MDHRLHLRGAFTLIEMMIGVALGALVVTVAVTGLQVSSQTITLTNRLSLENAVLRAAVVAANREMDFWDTFDSRTDDAQPLIRTLRAPGCPFAPMSFTAPELLLEFDQSQPRLWWNGHLWSSNHKSSGGQQRFGDYSLFGRQGLGSPTVPIERVWRHNILPQLATNLGYYAALDYLPANFVFGFYDANGEVPDEFGTPGVGANRFRSNWHGGNKPLCRVEFGHDNGCILTTVPGKTSLPNTHPVSHHAIFNNSNAAFSSVSYPDGWAAFPPMNFLAMKPEHWPSVAMQVKVTFHWMDFRQQVLINQVDPLTGKKTSMILHGLTTTLRGARRQRDLDDMPADTSYP
jgi:prepilin-type N-terminal cleavage/methylation domain-containing protein